MTGPNHGANVEKVRDAKQKDDLGRNEPGYWLMIIGDTNCALLARMGRPFFAVSSVGARNIAAGDRCALYRARSGRGFVGIYEVTAPVRDTPTRVGARTYSIKIPWKPVFLSESVPAELPPLVSHLEFVRNKERFGVYFQTTLRRITVADFSVIEGAVRRNAQVPANFP